MANHKSDKTSTAANSAKKAKLAGKPAKRSLDPNDIVTAHAVGRRSALTLLGASAVGTTALVMGSRPAKADRFDVSVVGDPSSDADSGPFADAPGDADLTVVADGNTPPVERPAPRPTETPSNQPPANRPPENRPPVNQSPTNQPPPNQPPTGQGGSPSSPGTVGDVKSTDVDFGANADRFDGDLGQPGAGAAPTEDPVVTQPSPSPVAPPPPQPSTAPSGSDGDVVRFGDPADADTGSRADTGDRDVTGPGDSAGRN